MTKSLVFRPSVSKIPSIGLLVFMAVSCSTPIEQSPGTKSSGRIFPNAIVLSSNLDINAWTSDSIAPILNSGGEVIATGIARPFVLNKVDSLPNPMRLGSLNKVPQARLAVKRFGEEIPISAKRSQVSRSELAIDAIRNNWLVAASGDTIILGKEYETNAKVVKAGSGQSKQLDPWLLSEKSTIGLKTLGVRQGLPSNQIGAHCADGSGGFWFVSKTGELWHQTGGLMVMYDASDGYPIIDARAIALDSENRVWIGSKSEGIACFDGASFKQYDQSNGLCSNETFCILADPKGGIWAGTNGGGLVHINLDSVTHYIPGLTTDALKIYCLSVGISDDQIWIGTVGEGLFSFDGKAFTKIEFPEFPGRTAVYRVSPDSAGLWLNTSKGVFYLNSDSLEMIDDFNDGGIGKALSIGNLDAHGSYWVLYPEYLVKFNHETSTRYALDRNIPGININTFSWIEDKILMSTNGKGLAVYDPYHYVQYPFSDEFGLNKVICIAEDQSGVLWFGNEGKELIMRKDGAQITYAMGELFTDYFYPTTIKFDSQNTMWIGDYYRGLLRVDANGDVNAYDFGLPFNTFNIVSLLIDKSGKKWIGTRNNGVFIWEGNLISHLNDQNGLPHNFVTSLAEENGSVWLGTYGGGLVKITGDEIKIFSEREGLPSSSVLALVHDQGGNLWAGTESHGIFRISGDSLLAFNTKHGLVNDAVTSISCDNSDQIWCATTNGISVLNLDNRTPVFQNYTYYNGLMSNYFTEAAVLFSPIKNELWLGGNESVNMFRPEVILPALSQAPMIYTAEVIRDTGLFAVSASNTIPYNDNNILFSFGVPDFLAKDAFEYTYRLQGASLGWSDPKYTNEQVFSDLAPGNYVFEVKARQNGTEWSSIQSWPLHIARPWWSQWWAYLIYALAAAAAALFIFRLILERKLAQNNAAKMEELDRLKTDFFSNLSHEFRTPLTLIHGTIPQMEMNFTRARSGEFYKNLDVLKRNSRDLMDLVSQLLDLSRLERNKYQVKLTPFRIDTFLKITSKNYYSYAERMGIMVDFELPPEPIWVMADERAMERVMKNLMGNALKFTKHGQITILMKKDNKDAIIEVKDTGVGIPEAEIAHIFERFYQVDSSETRKYEGTGIGLSLVKELVTAMQGSIQVKSTVGEGSCFYFRLALAPATAVPVETTNATAVAGTYLEHPELFMVDEDDLQDPDPRKTILIVDDHEDIRDYLVSLLKSKYHMLMAADGAEGCTMATEFVPDFIIADWMMPKMTGAQMITRLKAQVETSHIPILLLTGKSDTLSRVKGLDAGAEAYLAKPFEPSELIAQIESLIRARRQIQIYHESTISTDIPNSKSDEIDRDKQFLQKTKKEILNNINNPELNAEVLAETHRLSRSQFARKLRALTGKNATELIREIRMGEAQKYLSNRKDLTISEIAYAVGYSEPAYFSRVFSNHTSMTPTEWREGLKSG